MTRLLKDSLGGNCRTAMIANVSPSHVNYEDTHNTLKYAKRASQIKTKVVRNVVRVNYQVSKYIEIIKDLRSEVAELKARLADAGPTRGLAEPGAGWRPPPVAALGDRPESADVEAQPVGDQATAVAADAKDREIAALKLQLRLRDRTVEEQRQLLLSEGLEPPSKPEGWVEVVKSQRHVASPHHPSGPSTHQAGRASSHTPEEGRSNAIALPPLSQRAGRGRPTQRDGPHEPRDRDSATREPRELRQRQRSSPAPGQRLGRHTPPHTGVSRAPMAAATPIAAASIAAAVPTGAASSTPSVPTPEGELLETPSASTLAPSSSAGGPASADEPPRPEQPRPGARLRSPPMSPRLAREGAGSNNRGGAAPGIAVESKDSLERTRLPEVASDTSPTKISPEKRLATRSASGPYPGPEGVSQLQRDGRLKPLKNLPTPGLRKGSHRKPARRWGDPGQARPVREGIAGTPTHAEAGSRSELLQPRERTDDTASQGSAEHESTAVAAPSARGEVVAAKEAMPGIERTPGERKGVIDKLNRKMKDKPRSMPAPPGPNAKLH